MGTTGRSEVADGLRERVIGALRADRDLGGPIAELRALPDRPERGRIAVEAVEIIMTGAMFEDPRRWPEIDALLELADGAEPATDEWARIRTIAATTSLVGSLVDGRSVDAADVSARLDALGRERPGDPVADAYLSAVRSMLGLVRSTRTDDPAAVHAVMEDLTQQVTAAGGDASGPLAGAASESTAWMGLLAGGRRLSDEELHDESVRADGPHASGYGAAMRHMSVCAAALRGGEETDPRRIDLAVGHARKAVDLTGPGDARRVLHLTGLALAHLRRFELAPSTSDDLRSSRDHLEEARSLAGGPAHPQWLMIGEMLTEVRRHLGDDPDVVGPVLDGLREHVWRVLAQDDPREARAAAREAAEAVVTAARTCLAHRKPAEAVRALDTGRGLALFAATAPATIGDLLDRAGRPELAGRWREAADSELPASLRREVLTVLTETDDGAWLDPPTPDRIGRALRAVDADALAYLMRGDHTVTGFAVVVSAAGRAGYMALPNLAAEHYRVVEEYLAMAADRDAAGRAAEGLEGEFGDKLDELCTWAWGAAMGPLVESYLPGLPAPSTDRPPRIVLVPMGELARIPWQAAHDSAGRYAVERVAVSQAASARMLCRSADLPAVASTAGGLVVGDPEGDPQLADARPEAYAIRGSFYRGARYLGHRPNDTPSPSGPGTVGEVLRWMTSNDPSDGVVAHLACHGFVEASGDDPTAYLVLADGERLHARDLLVRPAERPGRAIGLVVLSACRTGGSVYGHDEAYSLGTALLAAGVRTVLCTQWNAGRHAALMYMVHHYHRTEGLPAWAALRRAQLWALDRRRRIPDGMPEPLHRFARSGTLERVIVWASIVHWGQ